VYVSAGKKLAVINMPADTYAPYVSAGTKFEVVHNVKCLNYERFTAYSDSTCMFQHSPV
jgi:hypothetical protein